MPKKVKERAITIPRVKEILESIDEGHFDQFQRRSLDYAVKFSKVDASIAEELVNKLTEQFGLEEAEAVQMINCMPESMEEIRTFLASGRRTIETSKLEGIITLLDKYREKKE